MIRTAPVRITLTQTEPDPHGRYIARLCVDCPGHPNHGLDLNEAMVQQGMAWAYQAFTNEYAGAEAFARRYRIGIWHQGSDHTAPWEHRWRQIAANNNWDPTGMLRQWARAIGNDDDWPLPNPPSVDEPTPRTLTHNKDLDKVERQLRAAKVSAERQKRLAEDKLQTQQQPQGESGVGMDE